MYSSYFISYFLYTNDIYNVIIMTNVLKEILKEYNDHKGEFVINGLGKVMRFVGISEDEYDYSYVLYTGSKLYFETVLVKLIFLKGKIDDSDYKMIEKSARLNHDIHLVQDNSTVLGETVGEYITEIMGKHPFEKFHTPLIFK